MFFDELSNDEWALLAALVSDEPAVRLNRRGRPRAEPRIVANAVLWILTTGEPWSKLPGRYPSGPTCRRRFEEWQLNGTLLEMVRLLSQTGRTFAYVPQPVPPVTAKPAAPAAVAPSVRDENLRGVSWRSPESWQAPGVSSNLSHWRSADPMADITRQLSGLATAQPSQQAVARAPAAPARAYVPAVARTPLRAGLPRGDEAGAVGAAMQQLDAAIASARGAYPCDDQRSPLSMSLAPRGTQIDDSRGYAIFIAAEPVPNAMYRAWAEILKDGKRVERSGLVGPRFADEDEAQQYALEWARQWIDRECQTQAVAEAACVSRQVVAEPQRTQAMAPARPLPAMRHVPEPVTIHHGGPLQSPLQSPLHNNPLHGPLHGPLHAFRGPLRRYPSEPVAATAVNAATESTSSERYPSYPEFISHVG